MSFLDTDAKCVDNTQNSISIIATTLFFYWFATVFAGLTILTHVSQVLHLSFMSYLVASIGTCFITVIFWLMILNKQMARINIHDTKTLLFLLSMGVAGSIVALITNRPATDDYYYIPNAVYYIQNPDALMGFKIHYLFSGTIPFESFAWATSSAYEYIQAIIAYCLQIDFLSVYYLLSPVITGFMIPLAFFLAIAHFSDDTSSAAIGTLITMGVVLLLGETDRTFGISSFVRIFQGKAILLSIGIPLFVAFSINYFAQPSFLAWMGLFSVATALTGMSSSTGFILPALSTVLILAYLLTAKNYKITTVPGYLISMGYVAIFALYILIFWTTGLNNTSPANQDWPTTFFGHAKFFINPNIPLTPLLAIATTILSILMLSGKRRQFLIVWMVATLGIFLNPATSTMLIKYVTSPNAYWRMFYIYPFPLIIGVLSSAIFTRTARFSATKQIAFAAFTGIALFGAVCLFPSSVFRQSNIRISWPDYKLPVNSFEQAKEITAIAPPGVMLAPQSIAGTVVMLDSRFPQIRIRNDAERTWLYSNGRQNEAGLRIAASDYLDGDSDDFLSLQGLLTLYSSNIRSIVIKKTVLKNNIDIKNLLIAHKFINQQAVDGYVVFWK